MKNFTVYSIFFIFLLYLLFFILTIHPSIDLIKIKNRDFGSYSISLFLFSLNIILLNHYLKDISRLFLKFKTLFYIFLLSGILFRILCWGYPAFSTDPYRYSSDGATILEGKNPYQSAVQVKGVSYPNYRTIYPLFAQLFFVLGAFLSSSKDIFKIIFGMVEIIFLIWLYFSLFHKRIAKGRVSSEQILLLFFLVWNPLSIFECHVEGHLDILSLSFFIYSIFNIHCRRFSKYQISVLSALASFASKFQGLLLFPLLFLGDLRRKNKLTYNVFQKHTYLWWFVLALFWVTLILMPYHLADLTQGQSGIKQYFQSWLFSHSIFFILQNFTDHDEYIIKLLQRVIIFTGVLILLLWYSGRIRTHQYVLFSITLFLVFFPVQHPWYYLIGLYGVIFSKKYRLLWMLILTSISFNYLAYQNLYSLLISLIPWLNVLFFYSLSIFLKRNLLTR